MSQADQDKSMDKKEIAEEEREKMLNAENTKHSEASNPTGDSETEEQKPKKKIPIGGIKMPGFCRTKSKEPCKEEDGKTGESGDADGGAVKENEQNTTAGEKANTPAKETKEVKEKEGRKGILDAIRLPLVSVFPRKKHKEGEVELGTTGAAGLASVETLDDSAPEKNALGNEDGMETIRLDGDGQDDIQSPKQSFLVACISAARRNLFVLVASLCILLSVVIIICVACVGPQPKSAPLRDGKYIEAVTSCGPVEGILEGGAYAFRGIPYAVPPLENRRWQPAEPLDRIENCWNNTYLAHNSSEVCWQRVAGGNSIGSEDCLYLDVFTPAVRYDSPLPVVVMIGAETLSGPSPGVMLPSANLARVREMVLVRPNFRLGVFGFLAAEPLSRSTHPPTSGNYGLSDIVAALQWVKLNIEHFGGNKESVILWGHRAGGTLVTSLVGTRRAKGLFSRAWISSASAIFPGRALNESEKLSAPFLSSIRCADASCLRSKKAQDVMDAVPESWHVNNVGLPEPKEATNRERRHGWLVLDGAILQEPVGQVWTKDEFPVKVVLGSTAHAGAPEKYLTPNATLNSTQVEKIVQESLLGTSGLDEEALKRYNSTLSGLLSMISDIRVVCPLLTVARMRTDIPFYVATQPRGNFADPDSDAAAILGSYAARTPEEKRHLSAIQQLFNYYVWHGKVPQIEPDGAKRLLLVGQDTLLERDYPNCDFWIEKDIVPLHGRID